LEATVVDAEALADDAQAGAAWPVFAEAANGPIQGLRPAPQPTTAAGTVKTDQTLTFR
jgi:hypothetical protein